MPRPYRITARSPGEEPTHLPPLTRREGTYGLHVRRGNEEPGSGLVLAAAACPLPAKAALCPSRFKACSPWQGEGDPLIVTCAAVTPRWAAPLRPATPGSALQPRSGRRGRHPGCPPRQPRRGRGPLRASAAPGRSAGSAGPVAPAGLPQSGAARREAEGAAGAGPGPGPGRAPPGCWSCFGHGGSAAGLEATARVP